MVGGGDANENLFKAEVPPVKLRRKPSWQVRVEYANQPPQEIVSAQSYLTDRPEDFYLALLEYFEPEEGESDEEYTKNVSIM